MQCPHPDSRSGHVIFSCHCLLNANAKVCGLAKYPGMLTELVSRLDQQNIGIVQLPCPEFLHLGPKRWWQTRSQYDVPAYHALCQRLALEAADQASLYLYAGYTVSGVLGVEGSPSCGVNEVYDSPDWGGKPNNVDLSNCRGKGAGIFIQALQNVFSEQGLDIDFVGISSSPDAMHRQLDRILGAHS